MTIEVLTEQKRQIVDITGRIEAELSGNGGLVNILALHTTAAITIADLDPGTDQDYLKALEGLTPGLSWSHPHDPSHFPDHLWSALIGQSLTLPYEGGRLILGAYQRVILIELDGPRNRQLAVKCLSQ